MHHASAARALDAALELIDGVRARNDPRLSAALVLLGIGTASEELLRDAPPLAAARDVPLAMMYASVAPEHGGVPLPVDALDDLRVARSAGNSSTPCTSNHATSRRSRPAA